MRRQQNNQNKTARSAQTLAPYTCTETTMTTHALPAAPQTGSDGYPALHYAWYMVAVLLVVYSIAFVDRIILNLMVAPIRAELQLTDTGISLLQGFAFTIFYSVFGIILGRHADRKNRKLMIIIGVAVWCVATAACGLASNVWQLFIARIFVGAGEAALSPAAYSMICDSFRRQHRARAISTYSMGVFLGIGCALIFGGMLVASVSKNQTMALPWLGELAAWRASLIIVGLGGLLSLLLIATLREPSRKEVTQENASFADALQFFKSRRAALASVVIPNSLIALINYSISAWLPAYFMRVFQWKIGAITGAYGTVLLTVGCVGILGGGWLADKLVAGGRRDGMMFVQRWTFALLIVVSGWIGFGGSPTVAITFLAITSFLTGVCTGLGPAAVNAITPNQYRGQAMALYLFCAAVIGLGVGPTAVALCTDYLFGNDNAVGSSLGLVLAAASVLGAIAVFSGARAYREALDRM
jgi:MFS family permease